MPANEIAVIMFVNKDGGKNGMALPELDLDRRGNWPCLFHDAHAWNRPRYGYGMRQPQRSRARRHRSEFRRCDESGKPAHSEYQRLGDLSGLSRARLLFREPRRPRRIRIGPREVSGRRSVGWPTN